MRQIRNWVDHLSVKKKLVFYGYLTITPVLVVICLVLFFFNYRSGQQEKYASDYASVQTLAESMEIMQTDIRDFSTYISINNDIQNLLSRSDVTELNRNAKVWFDEAPMRIVQDMIALKGHIKTIAIYPENGLRPRIPIQPALRCRSLHNNPLDSSLNIRSSLPQGGGLTGLRPHCLYN